MRRLMILVLCLPLLSCGGKSSSKGGGKGGKAGKGGTPKPADLVAHDLSPAGEKWKGFSAKAPKGCKVMKDLLGAARLACGGGGLTDQHSGFDLIFTPKKRDLAKYKARAKKRWDKKKAKGEFELLEDKPGLLAWMTRDGKFRAYLFLMHLKVGGRDITCHPNLMRGGGVEAEHKLHLAACKTLVKK